LNLEERQLKPKNLEKMSARSKRNEEKVQLLWQRPKTKKIQQAEYLQTSTSPKELACVVKGTEGLFQSM
jgi:hypothetical protein